MEIWKPVPGTDGKYEASNHGNIRSTWLLNGKPYTKIMKTILDERGYAKLTITLNGKKTCTRAHILVCKAFHGLPPSIKHTVNHKDGNKLNNHYTNLEWITQKENVHHHGKDTSHPRKVIQKSLNGEIVATFNSISEAAASINKDRTTVSRVCNGKNKTAGGYIFEYEDDKHKHQEIDKTVEHKIIKDFPKYLVF